MSSIIDEGGDKLDLESGYFTRKSFIDNNIAIEKYEKTCTQLIRDTKQTKDGAIWYLTTIALPGGILFPAGTTESYHWLVAPVIAMEEDMKSQYSDVDETRVAVEQAKKFDKFQEALVYLGML